MLEALRSTLRRNLLPSSTFEGTEGAAWFAGFEPRAPSISEYFCGDEVTGGSSGRVLRSRIPAKVEKVSGAGGLPIVRLPEPAPELASLLERSISVPDLVDIHTELPGDVESLRDQLRTSTTKEDFRRIRRANFTYRVTAEPDAIREFHTRHYLPLVEKQFPEDGRVKPLNKMLAELRQGGELVCADIEGEWVAGIMNIDQDPTYALMTLGIRDADEAVRQKRVVAALIVRSLERAVELGRDKATLGRSLPFLGKGPVWFKAKWNGIISHDPNTPIMHMFMDLRHAAVRQMLASSPVIHVRDGDLVTSKWLDPGERPLKATTRDAGRFPGIARWYVLGEPETLQSGAEELSEADRITTIPITPTGESPIWLSEALDREG